MNARADRELQQVAGSFRARARRIVAAVVVNATLAATCLGAPYVRGRLRADESRQQFGSFAACLLGGKASPRPGLSMPSGTTARFASRYMADDPNWPARCMPALDAVAPEPAIFLWPAVKQADEDVRATVRLTRRELEMMADQRGDSDDIPVRPLLAIQKIRAALTLQAKAAGNDWDLDGNAITIPRGDVPPRPTSLPLNTTASASLDLWTHEDGLDALSTDGSGITWLRVAQGEVDRIRVRRTSLVRGTVLQGGVPLVLWATPEERCAEREDRCVRRATGVAHYELGARKLPVPIWLAGHPAGELSRSIRVEGRRLWLLSRRDAEGGVEVRQFELPEHAVDGAPPQSASRRYGPQGAVAVGAMLLEGRPPPLYFTRATESGLRPHLMFADGATHTLSPTGKDSPWAKACTDGARTWIAHGDAYTLRISHFEQTGAPAEVRNMPVNVRTKAEGGAHAAVQLHCDDEGVHVLHLDSKLSLHHARCSPAGCSRGAPLLRNVIHFDAANAGDRGLLVAVSGGRNHKRVKTLRVPKAGDTTRPLAATACWQDGDGMCGAPSLLADGDRVLLATREAGNLQVLETRDRGDSWQPMPGLKMGDAMTEGAHAPLEQHRVRKGIH